MAKVRVEVAAEDIGAGKPDSCRECPVALALNRAVPGLAPWWVGSEAAQSRPGDEHNLPPVAADFIRAFDRSGEGAPFAFEVTV